MRWRAHSHRAQHFWSPTPDRSRPQRSSPPCGTDLGGAPAFSAFRWRRSEASLYRTDLAAFTMGEGYNPKDAEGFIRLLGLPSRVEALRRAEKEKSSEKKPG